MADKSPVQFMAEDDSDAEEDETMLDTTPAGADASVKRVSGLTSQSPGHSLVFFENDSGALFVRTCKGTDQAQLKAPGLTERGCTHMRRGTVTTPLAGKNVVENTHTDFDANVPLENWSFFRGVPSGSCAALERHLPVSLVCATNARDAAARIARAHTMRAADYDVAPYGIPEPGAMAGLPS